MNQSSTGRTCRCTLPYGHVLIFGAIQGDHDQHLKATLQQLETAGISLNSSKCEFSMDHIKFLGHIIGKTGVRADPDKVSAIVEMGAPKNVPALG